MQMQFDSRPGREHREVGLQRDVAESDAADLHRGLLFGGSEGEWVSTGRAASAAPRALPWLLAGSGGPPRHLAVPPDRPDIPGYALA
ncbi:hypothetical protein GCM10010515_39020 [Streptomyces fructofermentans]|uniref:Uncharacterized protein n=1 Tax=Streptomyces fructofermentans TaxID=152141 RepID=A0A918KNH3_9ACTN|nr:hypothetical protein GCM10010515_39020 [Streptomyces fructofermentans]